MTLLQLNYLAEIAACGSINRAARKLFVSQSGMSNALRELEEELGISIFERHNKGVKFTEAGQRLFEQIQPIIEQEKLVLNQYSGSKGPPPVHLRISAQHYPFAVQAFVKLMQKQNGRYMLHFKETHLHVVIEDVAAALSEIGVLFLSNATEGYLSRIFDSRDLEFTLLRRVAPHVFLRKGHPLSGKKSIKLDELTPYPYSCFMRDRSVSYNFSEEVVLSDFDPPKSTVQVNDRATAYNIMAHTDAFSMGSGLLAEGYGDPNIISIPLVAPGDGIQLGWIRLKKRELSGAASQYVELLKESVNG